MALIPSVAPVSDAHIDARSDLRIDSWYATHGPTAGDVITGADRVIVGTGPGTATDVATTYLYAERYGGLSTSTGAASANVATINAALAEADSGDYATVVMPPFSVPINDAIEVPDGVGMVGAGIQPSILKATHADAFLYFANPSYAQIGNFAFDGNSIAAQGIRADTSNGASFRNIRSHHVLGEAFTIHNVQNASFDNIDVQYSTRGFWVDDGSGSCVFNALKSSDNTEWQLKIGSSGVVASGYTEPTANVFIAPMLEWIGIAATTDAIATVVVEGSAGTMLLNANIVAPSGSTLARPAMKFSQAGTAAESSMTFANLNIIGNATYSTGIEATDFGNLVFMGRNGITGALVGMNLDGGLINIMGPLPTMNSVTTKLSFSGGSGENQITQYVTQEQFFQARTSGYVQRIQEAGESGIRFYQYSNGIIAWGDGSGFSPDAGLERTAANTIGTLSGDQFYAAGGITTMTKAGTPTDADVPFAVDGTMVTDTTASKLWIRLSGTWKSVTLT